MSDRFNEEDIREQVENVVDGSQKLDDMKRRVAAELSAAGTEVDGAQIIVAHDIDGSITVTDLGEVRDEGAEGGS